MEDFVLILLNDTKAKTCLLYYIVSKEISISEEYDLAGAKAKVIIIYIYIIL